MYFWFAFFFLGKICSLSCLPISIQKVWVGLVLMEHTDATKEELKREDDEVSDLDG
jgi:hypothetical protein